MSTTLTDEKFFSLAQAAEVTGFSLGRFRYNRSRLEELGATVSESGWSIPESALRQLGWLDGAVKPQVKKTKVSKLEEENGSLRQQVAELRKALEEEQGKKAGLFGRRKK